jgi:PAS domain-containing protein
LRKPHIANSFLWTQWEFSLQLNDNKEPLEILCIGHDITHVEELNEQTINMNALLLEHQNKYSSLFELSPVGIAVNSMDGHFLEVNTALSNMTGYSKSELLMIDYWTLTPQSYQEQEQEQLRGLHNLGSGLMRKNISIKMDIPFQFYCMVDLLLIKMVNLAFGQLFKI